MTNAVPIRIADAVAAEINAAVEAEEFQTLDFTARRSYPDWPEEFEDLDGLAVDVVHAIDEDENVGLASAGSIEYSPTIHVVIRKRLGTEDRDQHTGRFKNSAVDPLATLLDEIRRYFIARRLTGVLTSLPEVQWNGASQVKRWHDPHKLRMGLFEGFVQMRFTVNEAI